MKSKVIGIIVGLVIMIPVLIIMFGNGGPDRGEPVPSGKLAAIESGLNISTYTLRNGWAVKSEAFKSVYMIAAEIDGPGLDGDGDVGLWASTSLSSGPIYAVDALAKGYSVWPVTDITPYDDGADEAKAGVKR